MAVVVVSLGAAAAPARASDGETPGGEAAVPAIILPAREPIRDDGDARAASALSGGGFTLGANATLASEYRFRGVDLSGGDPALQGGIDITHDSGFYAGTFASTIDDDTTGYGAFELDLYAGWSGDVAEGLDVNLGVIAYTFPDAPAGDFDYVELYGSLGFTLGPARAVVGTAWDVGRDGLAFGGVRRDNLYLYTDLSAGVPGTPVTVNAHLGYTDGAVDFAGENVNFDWSLGADWAIRDTPLVLGVAYVDAAEDVALPGTFNPTSGTVVATLTAYF
ncbi:MAG: TorF family putative porin [Erythrobacter sp.]|jgi:uncharacterized protein (TIGR02001 family)|nr:TorF family putative porin [Erythrobacter sp.]